MLEVRFISRDEAYGLWDSFPKDKSLTGEEWNEAYTSLGKTLSDIGRYTGQSCPPADFWIGDDWFNSRHVAVLLINGKQLDRTFLLAVKGWVAGMEDNWLVSIAYNPSDEEGSNKDSPWPEILVTKSELVCSLVDGSAQVLVKRMKAAGIDLIGQP